MARSESDREELLREATALVERVELEIPGYEEPIVCGFRRDGAVSLFFGGDPVYQFNTAGQLRRAYIAGRIHKAEQGGLVSLTRERTATEVALVRTALSHDEVAAVMETLRGHLHRLHAALKDSSFVTKGQVPPEADVVARISRWLDSLPAAIEIAARPNVG